MIKLHLWSIFLLFTVLFLTAESNAQCVTDTSKHSPGVYPAGGKLDTVWIGEPYSETVTYVSQKDTTIVVTINPFPSTSVKARIDSVVIKNRGNNSSLNIPAQLGFICNTPNCTFPGNSQNCVKISGTVTNLTDTGVRQVKLNIEYYFTILTAPLNGVIYNLNSDYYPFNLVVKKRSANVGLNDNLSERIKISPNPVDDEIIISGIRTGIELKLQIFSLQGRLIYAQNMNPDAEELRFYPELDSGIYFLQIEEKNGQKSICKLIKN